MKIGRIKWEASDCSTGGVLGAGEREVDLASVSVELLPIMDFEALKEAGIDLPARRKPQYSKVIELDGQFSIGYSGTPEESPHGHLGIGLYAALTDVHSFSWEWFDIDAPGHGVKIQEGGELSFKICETGNGWEVCQTKFLTDVSFRISEMGDLPPEPRWRIKVFAGSFMNWPSLVNGEVISSPL